MVYDLHMADKKRKKKEHDFSVTAFRVVQEATGQTETETEQANTDEKKFAPVALGHLGGIKGGKARSEKLTPERRSEIAKKATQARWSQKELP